MSWSAPATRAASQLYPGELSQDLVFFNFLGNFISRTTRWKR